MTEEVTDAADPRVADYRNVPDPELLERRGLFVAEGRLVVSHLLRQRRFEVHSVMVTEPARRALDPALAERPEVPVYVVPQSVMNGITGFNLHRGCLALGGRHAPVPWQDVAAISRTMVLLEGVGNADNVGGVFRHAAALGADAILLDPASTDPLYRKSIRTSIGAALQIPFARMEPWPEAIDRLRTSSVTVIGMTPAATAGPLAEVAATVRGRRVALLFGHEGDGLSAGALARCDVRARIPMAGQADSINVAAAAAIALYELTRT